MLTLGVHPHRTKIWAVPRGCPARSRRKGLTQKRIVMVDILDEVQGVAVVEVKTKARLELLDAVYTCLGEK